MRYAGMAGLLSLVSSLLFFGNGAGANGPDGPMSEITSFKIYYGEPTPKALKELAKYDQVIVEPDSFSRKHVNALQGQGTKVLGYVSVMELEDAHAALVNPSDYLLKDGKKWYIQKWDTYMMDIREPHYRDIVFSKIDKGVASKGMDGIMFDTAGNIDDYFSDQPELQDELRAGYVELLQRVEREYPDLYVMQNWGFGTVRSASLPYIDGVLWEDFNKSDIACDGWAQKWIRYFKSQRDLDVLTVTNNCPSFDYSRSLNFSPTINPNDIYDEL